VIYYYPGMTSEQEIKKIFNYSPENYLDIKLNKIDMQYSFYIERPLINFMNKVIEMEQNKKKKIILVLCLIL